MMKEIYKTTFKYSDVVVDSFVFNHQQFVVLNNNVIYDFLKTDYYINVETYSNKLLLASVAKIENDYILYYHKSIRMKSRVSHE